MTDTQALTDAELIQRVRTMNYMDYSFTQMADLASRFAALLAQAAAMRKALEDCANDLEGWVEDYYEPTKLKYPSERRRYERDIEPVVKARALLNSTPSHVEEPRQAWSDDFRRASVITTTAPSPVGERDEDYTVALDSAAAQFETYARQDQIGSPEQRRKALDDSLQHALGILSIRRYRALAKPATEEPFPEMETIAKEFGLD